ESENDDNDEDVANEEYEEQDNGLTEKTFKFDDFARRLLHPKIVRACTLVLTDWTQIPTKALKAAVTILHRIAYGCSCPGMLYQAKLFRIFQQVFSVERDVHQEELRRLGIFVLRKFVEVAPTNPKIYAELLFYKGIREANELETGYCDAYEAGTKGVWTEAQETELRFLFEENQRNPSTDTDVIDWILENIVDKTRTRRGVLKKLQDMGLQFKAPTKRSTKAAQAGKNLWPPEEDEQLSSLYDQHRLEPDCLQRIVQEFEERRNKQQIIKRMLQLHLIADKSEILPAKPKRKSQKQQQQQQQNESDDDNAEQDDEEDEDNDEEFMQQPRAAGSGATKKSKPRQVVRTPLDVGTVRALIGQLDGEQYQGAFEWLRECLDDASEDTEEAAADDDGVPLLPLLEIQKAAMEQADFHKVLLALGLQPPIAGMENYWRIPTYLNAADLKMRAKIVSGEEVEEPDAASEADELQSEEEEDFLEKHSRQRQQAMNESIAAEQQRKLDTLMFSKSDEESEQRAAPPPPVKAKRQRKKKAKSKQTMAELSEEEEEQEEVNEIARKLARKKRKAAVSSEEEADVEPPSKPNTDDLFEQLKAKRATKIKSNAPAKQPTVDEATAEAEAEDAYNFNSEDYRARLQELEDEEEQQQQELDKENVTIKSQRTRRANVIDSDSDEDDAEDVNVAKAGKRPRPRSDSEQDTQANSLAAELELDSDEDVNFLARKKQSNKETNNKRRRVAVIDDDDDDDDF
ncbi:timeout, partial [Drosophila busckii]